MSNQSTPESQSATESNESFSDIFSQYEKSHARKAEDRGKQIEGTVIAISAESVFLDIGFKSEGILALSIFRAGETGKAGDKPRVSVTDRDPERYYTLS